MNGEQPGLLEGAIPPERNTVLYGHDPAQDFLANAYRSGRMHHAILIEGAEGIGKATLAYRFAHHVLTHPDPLSAPDRIADPDLDDPIGRQISSGASHNVLHLARPVDEKTGKAKSVITVDEVRRAGKFFGQTSGTGNWRVAIIDPADDLNRNAANAISVPGSVAHTGTAASDHPLALPVAETATAVSGESGQGAGAPRSGTRRD